MFSLSKGQNNSINIATVVRTSNSDIYLSPVLGFNHNKNSFLIGYDFINSYGYLLTGYQYIYSDSSQKLKVFFPIDIMFKSEEIHRFDNYSDRNEHIIDTKLTAGYGIKYTFFKGFYINSQSGIEIQNIFKKEKGTSNGFNYSYNIHEYGLGCFLQVGFGYELKIKK